MVVEYHYMKKILFSTIIILIIFLSLYFILINQTSNISQEITKNDKTIKYLNQQYENKINLINFTGKSQKEIEDEVNNLSISDTDPRKINTVLTSLMTQQLNSIFPFYQLINPLYDSFLFILPISISIIIKHFIEHSRKLFKLYLAKGCFRIVKKSSDEIDKAKYFMIGLIWYNKFLKHTFNLQINNIDTIFEMVFIKSPLDTHKTLLSISKSFENEKGFDPLRHLTTVLPNAEGEKILTKQSLRTRIQESSDLIIPIVTTIVTLITTFFIKPL